jgi:hypothetical protein
LSPPRSGFSSALAPAGGSVEYELAELKADTRRLRELAREQAEQTNQWMTAFMDAEAERLRLQRENARLRAELEARS